MFNIDIESADFLFLHQANKYIDEKICKLLKMPSEKVPYCIQDFGNVTSASIPLTMVSQSYESLSMKENHCIACGFGVGLACASMEFTVDNIVVSKL